MSVDMGFREFISSFRYRRQLEDDWQRRGAHRPPASPSPEYVSQLVGQLLDESVAYDAQEELSMIGAAAVPTLISASADPRYHAANWSSNFSAAPTPLDSLLELLVPHAEDEVLRISGLLLTSPNSWVRKTVAIHLASLGRSDTIAALNRLIWDDNGYVRSGVRIGIDRAIRARRVDETFSALAYELLLSQCDQDWGPGSNNVPKTLIGLDRGRAAKDLADARWLNIENKNVDEILGACNSAGIALPDAILRGLLDYSLPLVSGERCHSHHRVAANALVALAIATGEGARPEAERLLGHENGKIREAAAKALATISGQSDPVRFVCDRVQSNGYESLSHQQRVVYCAFLFEMEVCNGGLLQFFGNSSGDHVGDTLIGLRELKHTEGETALATACRFVGPLAYESDRELRLDAFEGRFDELRAAFAPLERDFYRTSTDLRQAWLLYATQHSDHFGDERMKFGPGES